MTEHWTNDERWLVWFYEGVVTVGRGAGKIDRARTIEDPMTDDAVLELVSSFIAENNSLGTFAAPADAANAFKGWIFDPKPPRFDQPQTITVELSKTYGGVTVKLGWSGLFDVKNRAAMRPAFEWAIRQVEAQFAAFEQHDLPRIASPAVQPSNIEGGSNHFRGDILTVELKDGKLYYKVKGGPYSKWGVRLWPEVAEASGVELPTEVGDHEISWNCSALMLDGNPKKVVAINV